MRRLLVAIVLLLACNVYAQQRTAPLSWIAPTTNEDGSSLSDLDGYRLCVSTSSIPDGAHEDGTVDCSLEVSAPNPAPSPGETVLFNLTLSPGEYFVRVYAFDNSVLQNKSDLSNEIKVDILAPSPITLQIVVSSLPNATMIVQQQGL